MSSSDNNNSSPLGQVANQSFFKDTCVTSLPFSLLQAITLDLHIPKTSERI